MGPLRSGFQAWAEQESTMLAQGGKGYYRRVRGHPRGNAPGARFTGTGYSSNPQNVGTCTPSARLRLSLVGDATIQGSDGMYYRTRVWN